MNKEQRIIRINHSLEIVMEREAWGSLPSTVKGKIDIIIRFKRNKEVLKTYKDLSDDEAAILIAKYIQERNGEA